jgi:two-component system, OmpR family, sensor histidine kinase VicK
MLPGFGIRTKLLLSILATLLLSYSVLLYSTMNTLSDSLRTETEKNLEASLKFARHQYLERANIVKYSLMHTTSSDVVQQRMRTRDLKWLNERAEAWHNGLPFLEFLIIIDGEKNVLVKSNSPGSGESFDVPGVVDQALAGKRVVISTELMPAPLLCQAGVTDFCSHQGTEALVVVVATPVVKQDGEVLGCIVTGEIMNQNQSLPTQLKELLGSGVEITITQQGLKIASTLAKNLPGSNMLPERVLEVLKRGEIFRGEAEIGRTEYETAIEPLLNSRGEFVGSLSVAISTDSFKKLRHQHLDNIIVAALVGIGCCIFMGYFVTRKVTKPLRQLARVAHRIEEGDLDQRVDDSSPDEVGLLASSFNTMAQALRERDGIIKRKTSDLQELNERLERNVAQRTAALSMEMGRLEAVLTSMAEGVVVTDHENRVVLFNPAAQQMFELMPHRVIGQPISEICAAEGFAPLLPRIKDLGESGRSIGSKEDLSVKGKRLNVYLSALSDEEGTFAGLVLSMRDVTMETQVDRMKTEFISTVSHELKTPLTSMKGSLQLLLSRGKWLTETERQLLAVCLRNTQRLIRLIGEILDISGIESGGMIFNFKPVSVGEVTVYAVEEIKSYAMGRDITIVNSIGEHLPQVYGDSDRLIQVVTNLLSNAVKFSPEGKVVMVNAEREGNYVVVSVADRGKVIQWADREKLFKKFQQIDNAERGKVAGTGLGLAICKEIVERHHGRIFYTAAKEWGNTFSFTVPIIGETDGIQENTHC